MSDIDQPKPFMVTCKKCRHAFRSTGLTEDLSDLTEVKGCPKCGGPRMFRCPKCAGLMKMVRVGQR